MYCPFCCKSETKVLESRVSEENVRRRRECLDCTNRFTTYEKVHFNFNVAKKNGQLQAFDENKLSRSVKLACAKLENEALIQKIKQKIISKKINPIPSKEIGKIVLKELKKIDKMAYLRFASVYKEIDNPESLKKELKTIIS